jgi:hypothetical protein
MKKVTTREQLSSKLSCVTLFRETLFNGSYNRGKAYMPEREQRSKFRMYPLQVCGYLASPVSIKTRWLFGNKLSLGPCI